MHVARGLLTVAILLGAPALASTAADPGDAASDAPRDIAITAHRFEFTPKEITIRKGETVRLLLTSEDVTHGFFMRKLGIDEEIEPGKTTEVRLTPQQTGDFTTICDHFCGSGHGGMKMTIHVQ